MQRRTKYKNVLQRWIGKATFEELKQLATLVGTSVEVIRQTANAYRTDGVLSTTPELAKKIERAASKLQREGLPAIKREKLCAACGDCEFAKRCRKEEADEAFRMTQYPG